MGMTGEKGEGGRGKDARASGGGAAGAPVRWAEVCVGGCFAPACGRRWRQNSDLGCMALQGREAGLLYCFQ
jgi:hypothetical protein